MAGTRIAARPAFTRWVDALYFAEARLDVLLSDARYADVVAALAAIEHATYRNERITTQADALLAAVNAACAQTSYTRDEEDR